MARPVIGICTVIERARWSVWDQEAYLLSRSYVRAVQRAGGLVVMIPPDESLHEDPDEVLDIVDGLVLAGGADIDPSSYGAERHPETKGTVPERDAFEIALARRAMDRDIPLLGICRGMQLMNVATGGTLLQHLPDSHGHHEHRRALGSFDDADHDVRLVEGSLAHRIAGETIHQTKSHHHQGVDRVGDGFEVTGWAVIDELPEAMEMPGRRFTVGVQWHPEADERSRFLHALVEQAGARRGGRDGRVTSDGGASRDGGAALDPGIPRTPTGSR
jgi:putative glutamine amidotransferase